MVGAEVMVGAYVGTSEGSNVGVSVIEGWAVGMGIGTKVGEFEMVGAGVIDGGAVGSKVMVQNPQVSEQ
jgi:hypothetical protein